MGAPGAGALLLLGVGDLFVPGEVRAASAGGTSDGREGLWLCGKGIRADIEGPAVGDTGDSRLGRPPRASGLGMRSGRPSPLRAEREETDDRVRVRADDWDVGAGLAWRRGALARDDLRGGDWASGGFTSSWSLVGRRAATDRGDCGGLSAGIWGTGGTGAQTWLSSSEMLTGWLQVEHLTVGRIWEIRSEPGAAGARREAMKEGGGSASREEEGGSKERDAAVARVGRRRELRGQISRVDCTPTSCGEMLDQITARQPPHGRPTTV